VTTLQRAWQPLTGAAPGRTRADLAERYPHFQVLLPANHQVLNQMADRAEKLSGDYLFDLQYIRSRLLEAIPDHLELSPHPQGNLVEARLAKYSPEQMADCLTRLGKLTLSINQLDISLVSDSMINWYIEDFIGQ
jgi:hypothetical protein